MSSGAPAKVSPAGLRMASSPARSRSSQSIPGIPVRSLKVDFLAPTDGRLRKLPRAMGQQQDEGAGRWFLQDLEQGIRSVAVHDLGRVNDGNFARLVMWFECVVIDQTTNLVDDDAFFIFFSDQNSQIRVIASRNQSATAAPVTSIVADPCFT